MNKIIRNSFISIIVGVIISAIAGCFSHATEPVNYIGAMFVFGGCIFLDQWIVTKIFGEKNVSKRSLLRLPVFILLSVVLLLLPRYVMLNGYIIRIFRSFGISLLLLALWRFFTFTTVEK